MSDDVALPNVADPAVVTPKVSLGQNNSPFPPCARFSKLTEFSQNTSEPARVWTKQPHLLKLFPPPPPLKLPCLDEEWGAGVSSIKPVWNANYGARL